MKLEKLFYSIALLISASEHYDSTSIFDKYCIQVASSSFDFNLSKDPNKIDKTPLILEKIENFKKNNHLTDDDTWLVLFAHYFIPNDVFESLGMKAMPGHSEIINLISRSNELSKILKEACSASSIDFNSVLGAFVYENTKIGKNRAELKDDPSIHVEALSEHRCLIEEGIACFSNLKNNPCSFRDLIAKLDGAFNSDKFSLIIDINMLVQFSKCLKHLFNLLYNFENLRVQLISLFRSKLFEFLIFYSDLEKSIYKSLPEGLSEEEKKNYSPLKPHFSCFLQEFMEHWAVNNAECNMDDPTVPTHINSSEASSSHFSSIEDVKNGNYGHSCSDIHYSSNKTSRTSTEMISETFSAADSTDVSFDISFEARPRNEFNIYLPSKTAALIDAEDNRLLLEHSGPRCNLSTRQILLLLIPLFWGGIYAFGLYYFFLSKLTPYIRDIIKRVDTGE